MHTIHVNATYESIRAAGRAKHGRDEGVAQSIAGESNIETPEHIQRFRETREPGARIRHPGVKLDDDRSGGVHGGYFKGPFVHSSDVLNQAKPPAAQFHEERAEQQFYRSVKRAPLGKGWTAGELVLPPHASTPDFAFGIVSLKVPNGAKEAMNPPPVPPEEAERERIYERSHGAYGPGVQRTQCINWEAAGIDPARTTFGSASSGTDRGAVAAALGLGVPTAAAAFSGTRLIPKVVQDHHDTCGDPLGASRGRATLMHTVPAAAEPDRVFGKPSLGGTRRPPGPESTVASCLRGVEGADADAMQDADLGRNYRSGRPGRGGAAAPAATTDPSRRCGVPSVRTDIAPRTQQSIATCMDFGGGASAAELLSPSPYADLGVEAKDFGVPRSAQELAEIFEGIGQGLQPWEVQAVFAEAQRARGDGGAGGGVSIDAFRRVLDTVLEGCEMGEAVPAWYLAAAEAAGVKR